MRGRSLSAPTSSTVFVTRLVNHGVELVVNLAAGLDTTRRTGWPCQPSLRWVEVDLPDILDYKEAVLGRRAAGLRARTGTPPRSVE